MILSGIRAQARRRLADVSGMPRVEIRFDGVSKGARQAANETKAGIKSVGDQADRESVRVSKFGSTIRSALLLGAKAAAGGVVALGGAIAYTGFKFDDMRQKATIAFSTMLGSNTKANAFLDQLQAFAAKTPFNFSGLVQSSQRLLAMGFSAKQILPTLTAVGDASAAMGGDPEVMNRTIIALGQIQAKGKLASQEMMQLTENGIPAWQLLADKIGVSVPEAMALVEKRAVSSSVAVAALTEGMEKRYGGMMEKQSHTFSGLLSNLQDTFQQIAGKVMSPFFEAATRGMEKLVKITSGPGFTAGIQRFGDVLATVATRYVQPAIAQISGAIRAILPIVEMAARGLAQGFARVLPVATQIGQVFGRFVLPIIRELVSIAVAGFGAITRTVAAHRVELVRLATNLGRIVTALATVLLPVLRFVFTKVLPWAVGVAITALAKVSDVIAPIAETVAKVVRKAAALFSQFFNWLVKTAINVALQVVEPFSHLPGKLGGWARDAKDALHAQLDAMQKDAGSYGASTGDAWGKAYYTAANGWLTSVGSLTQGAAGAPGTKAGKGAGSQAGDMGSSAGTRFGIVQTAGTQIGIPYEFGGAAILGHHTDCSGLVQAVFAKNGINLPRTTYEQWKVGKAVSVSELEPGDLVFFHMGPRGPEHVGIYVGGDAFIEDPHTGASVRRSKLSSYPGFAGARRVISSPSNTAGAPNPKPKGDPAPPIAAPTYAPTDDLYGVGAGDVSGITGAGGAADAKSKAKAAATAAKNRAKAVAGIRDQVAELSDEYAKLPAAAKAKVAPKMKELQDALANVSDERTLAKARRALSAYKAAINAELNLQKAVQVVRDSAEKIADAIARLPASARAKIAPQMAALRKEIANVSSARDLAKVKSDLARIQAAVKAAIDTMTEDVKRRRDAFSQAFGAVADKALQVFDAKTDELIKKARIKFEGIDLGEGDRTPEEQALQAFRDARDKAQRDASRAADVAARDALLTGPADETEEDRVRRLQDLAAAEEKLRQDDLDDQERALETAADVSRKAADAELDAERARIQDERNLLRERFNGRLQEIQTAFENEQITADEAQRELLALLSDPDYQIDFNAAGDLIGAAFARGFTDALKAVTQAIADLRASAEALARATGQPNTSTDVVGVTDPGAGTRPDDRGGIRGADGGPSFIWGGITWGTGDRAAFSAWLAARGSSLTEWKRNHPDAAAAVGYRRGGRVPGQFIGREDTIAARLTPGEEVIDRSLSQALRRELLGGGRIGGSQPIYVLGTTRREVAKALSDLTAPEDDRRIGYSSSRA